MNPYEAACERLERASANLPKAKAEAERILREADDEYYAATANLRLYESQPGVPLPEYRESRAGGMNDLDRFTDGELCALHAHVYHWGICLFDATEHLMTQLRDTPYPSPAYDDLKTRYKITFAAAQEQRQLLTSVGTAYRARTQKTSRA
jgi:hypothetical protein